MATADDEQAWISQARKGDEQAYRQLVMRYQPAIARLVAHLMGPDHPSIEDIMQDAFVRAYFALDTFRGQASFRTWLTRIAVNRCRDERRRLMSRRVLRDAWARQTLIEREPFVSPAPAGDETDAVDPPDELGLLVQTAVRSLPEKLRVVVTLKDLEGHSYEEVSTILQCKLGTVKSRHARAREKLRRLLAPHVPGLQT